MLGLLRMFGDLVSGAIGNGHILALSVICLMQYGLHVYRRAQFQRDRKLLKNQVDGLESELTSVQKDRSLASLENAILREFVAQTDIENSLDLLLRRYIPDPTEGFAAFLHKDRGELRVNRSRGLSEQTIRSLRLDEKIVRQICRDRTLALAGEKLWSSSLKKTALASDLAKAEIVYLIAVGDAHQLEGVYLTTRLYPAGASLEQQTELARRLMVSVAGNLKRNQTLAMQENQLRSTNEILELRGITDRQYDAPVQMFEAFVDCLRSKIGVDRATLFLGSENDENLNPLVCCGLPAISRLMETWQSHEVRLAALGRTLNEPLKLDMAQLARLGVDTLIGRALVVPIGPIEGHAGVLCLSGHRQDEFTDLQSQLAGWSGVHLKEAIARVLAHADIERQARQDGLTDLANRRTFDTQANAEIASAARMGSDCSLLLIDLDRFKRINDTYGHLAGDEVLRSTASVLTDQIREIRSSDRALIARYGGEELAVLLPGIGNVGALRIAETIRSAVQNFSFEFGDQRIGVTVSIGIATYPDHAGNLQDLIAAADAGLYEAKQTGRNRAISASTESSRQMQTH